ncbi:MAG: maltodextrin glucosidase [Trueperaceae bacterium]|nr:maltodextrin glucosidase [Trueperaceae bacterium]
MPAATDPDRFDADHAAVPEFFEDRGARLRLRVRTRGPRPRHAHVRTEPDHEERLTPLRAVGGVDARGWSTYEAEVDVVEHEPVTRYAFRFVFEDGQIWLAADGLHPGEPDPTVHFRHAAGHVPAAWVWDAVFYQVFPDRFRNGDTGNDPPDGAWTVDGAPIVRRGWHERPTPRIGAREFFGGDLQGVREGLEHVLDLGASALYLNPVFASPSSHRYDTVDYARVDPHLGGDAALLELLADARAHGVRVVLDAVVNHTSERHAWFDRERRHDPPGAHAGPTSPTRDHYVFRDPADPESYVGWAGVRSLPVLDFASEGVRAKVYAGDDAILRRWLRPPWSIDGWRLDVVHMLGEGPGARRNHEHVAAMRRAIREERPEAYVLGEHFFDATAWLQGDEEDGAMNYAGFLRPMLAFWAGIDFRGDPERCDAAELDRRLARVRARVPWPMALSQYNLLSSHDVPRFLTRVGGDVDAFLAAQHALFAYVGVPSVYYGDEVGLEGGEDPDNRRPMPWDPTAWNARVHATVRRLAHLRQRHRALARGRYRTLLAEGDAFAFARVLDGEAVVCALHRRGGRLRVPLASLDAGAEAWTDALTSETATVEGDHLVLELPAGRAGGRLRPGARRAVGRCRSRPGRPAAR